MWKMGSIYLLLKIRSLNIDNLELKRLENYDNIKRSYAAYFSDFLSGILMSDLLK